MTKDAFLYVDPALPPSPCDGTLAGIQLAIQPNLSVRGWPTSAGSRALENYVAIEDATVVERLRSAGARIAGSTHVAELGLGLEGDTSAAAVASSQCDAALITDTLGEARVAAAQATLIGFKPTGGTVSRYGLIGLIPSMECIGIAARDVATVSAILQAISGPDKRDFSLSDEFPDSTKDSGGVRSVAVISQSLEGLSAAETRAFESALKALRKAGAKIREAPIEKHGLFRTVHQIVGATEASSSAGKYDSVRYGHRAAKADDWNDMYLKSREECFGPLIKAFLFQGAYYQFKDYPAFENACRMRRHLIEALHDIISDSEIIALPTTSKAASTGSLESVSQLYDRFALTLVANVAGLPAISLPRLAKAEDDDIGLQLVAGSLQDYALLGYADQLLSLRGDL